MDLDSLTQFLAPLLPYLLKGGIELAKSAAGDALQRAAEKP